MKGKISRREFLRTAAIAAAGTTLAGAAACQLVETRVIP